MKNLFTVLVIFCLTAAMATPALAQLNPNGSGSPDGLSNPQQLQPKGAAPDRAPEALPGTSTPALATGPNMQKPATGDPTAQLFTAINNADYNSAQDAVSRGADINAQNSLGETPLDLSIALNHNSITFMLLSARNESGGAGPATTPVAQTLPAPPATHPFHATRVKMVTPLPTAPMPANNPGTPNPEAGFLGFGPAK